MLARGVEGDGLLDRRPFAWNPFERSTTDGEAVSGVTL